MPTTERRGEPVGETGPRRMTIGRLARASGIAVTALRFYEASGLVTPAERTEAGYRLYDASALDRLRFIRSAQTLGLTLEEIASVLAIRDGGEAPCRHIHGIVERHIEDVDRQIVALQDLRAELAALERQLRGASATLPEEHDGVCPYVEQLAGKQPKSRHATPLAAHVRGGHRDA